MRAVAADEGHRLPEPGVLKTMVSRWENGARMGEFYQGLCDRIFGAEFEGIVVSYQPRPAAVAVAA
jgi:hypothetical protein